MRHQTKKEKKLKVHIQIPKGLKLRLVIPCDCGIVHSVYTSGKEPILNIPRRTRCSLSL